MNTAVINNGETLRPWTRRKNSLGSKNNPPQVKVESQMMYVPTVDDRGWWCNPRWAVGLGEGIRAGPGRASEGLRCARQSEAVDVVVNSDVEDKGNRD